MAVLKRGRKPSDSQADSDNNEEPSNSSEFENGERAESSGRVNVKVKRASSD